MNKAFKTYSLECTEAEAGIVEGFAQEHGTSPENCIREALRTMHERPGDGQGMMAVGERIQDLHREVQTQLTGCRKEGRDRCDGCRSLLATLRDARQELADIRQAVLLDPRFAWREA